MPKRVMTGTVVATKQNKTAIVLVERRFLHPLLKKTVRRTKRYHAHDENNSAKLGDTVNIIECPPKSKLKRWELMTVGADQ